MARDRWKPEPGLEASVIEHLDGVPWYDAPIPGRWHRCKPQSRGWLPRRVGGPPGAMVPGTFVERCACGATRFDTSGPWITRNERRRK